MSNAKAYIDRIFNETTNTAPKKQYIVMGQLELNTPEKLDSADDEHNANYLVGEYQKVLGTKWKIWKELNKLKG